MNDLQPSQWRELTWEAQIIQQLCAGLISVPKADCVTSAGAEAEPFHISLTQGWAPSRELLAEVPANPSGSAIQEL